jgi:ATP-binding cassette subfamily F protein uup
VVTGQRTKVAYYDQQRTSLDGEQTVYESAGGGAPGWRGEDFIDVAGRKVALRDFLSDLLFPPSMQKMKVKALSGGERNRLLLARLFLEGANVLVLDEPTNDLDLVTLNVLERLLLDFEGSVLLVTHDRYFLDKVATSILAFEGNGRAVRYPGNYAMYRRLKEQAEKAGAASASSAGARPGAPQAPRPAVVAGPVSRSRPAAPTLAKRPIRLGFKEQRELEGMEAAIQQGEARQAAAEAALADPASYQQGGAAVAALRAEQAAAQAEVERLYARWQQLEALKAGG